MRVFQNADWKTELPDKFIGVQNAFLKSTYNLLKIGIFHEVFENPVYILFLVGHISRIRRDASHLDSAFLKLKAKGVFLLLFFIFNSYVRYNGSLGCVLENWNCVLKETPKTKGS